MPLLKIETNVVLSAQQKQELAVVASKTTADMLGKSENYVMVSIQSEQTMLFAGSDEPLVYVELKSLGLPENQTQSYSASLCDMLEKHIGVSPERTYIEFAVGQRHLWGWSGRTF